MTTAARDLVRRFGSPLYVYETDQVRQSLADLRAVLPEPAELYYSLKANPHPALARTLRLGGCGAEISSPGELRAAALAGWPGGRCLYTGPAKTPTEIDEALRFGVRRFSVESADDLRRVGTAATELGVRADCLIRVSGVLEGAAGIRMSGRATQFGVPLDELTRDLPSYLTVPGTRVVGAHFFPVSNTRDEESLTAEFLGSVRTAGRLRALGLPMELVDLGGGFGAPFATRAVRERYAGLRQALGDALDEHLPGWRAGRPAVAFESGRYLVADCGRLLATVVEVKRGEDKTHVLIDSGINHLAGMSGSGRLLRPVMEPFVERRDGTPGTASDPGPVTVAGPLCTPADVLGHQVRLGEVEAGDVLVVPNVGAYGMTAGLLAFLSRDLPVEVVLDGGAAVSATRVELRRTRIRSTSDDDQFQPDPATQGERT
ncbi:type III PLP-dependent enzyme [Streptomyces canus]|uniref:type III PLP-dependent enzyme n=1 Tax=Streptomyces canus TaxID=58343 RepID=UPI00372323C2